MLDLESHKLSASVGVCILPYPGNTVTDIIKRADQAMYESKKSGGKNYTISNIEMIGHVV
jgi:diguanylate cyclase